MHYAFWKPNLLIFEVKTVENVNKLINKVNILNESVSSYYSGSRTMIVLLDGHNAPSVYTVFKLILPQSRGMCVATQREAD